MEPLREFESRARKVRALKAPSELGMLPTREF